MLYDLHSYISYYTSLRSQAIRRLVFCGTTLKTRGHTDQVGQGRTWRQWHTIESAHL